MMNEMRIAFCCPRCEQTAVDACEPSTRAIKCAHCDLQLDVPDDAWSDGRLRRCLACPSTDLFLRKDFPQRLGIAIVVTGFFFSSVAWYYHQPYLTYGILFATAAADLVLYLLVGDALHCYRCGAQYRGLDDLPSYEAFNLETHERHRQQAARLAAAPARVGRDQSDG